MGRVSIAGAAAVLLAVLGCDEARGGGGSAKGAELYRNQACSTCHGTEGTGTPFGPTLHGKKGHWTRETLVEYLKDPQAYAAKDARLAVQAKKFSLPMQRYDKLPPDALAALAEFVLALP